MQEPPTTMEQSRLDNEEYLDEDDEWATDFDDQEEFHDDFDADAYVEARR